MVRSTLKVWAIALSVAGLVGACTTQGRGRSNGTGLVLTPWMVPVDVANAQNNPTQSDYYNLGWQTFIAINWPAVAPSSANRGQPDTSLGLGASTDSALVPTVWQTYRDLSTTMLADGANPGPWNQPQPQPPAGCAPLPVGSVPPGFQPMILDRTSKTASSIDSNDFFINEASGAPLIDQLGRYLLYDVRIGQSEYSYIQMPAQAYYDAANQIAAYQSPNQGINPFPRTGQEAMFNPPLPSYAQFGALEVKAAWRVLDPEQDIFSRYFTQMGYFLQPGGACEGPVTFGLVGLHILRLTPTTPATWFWASFEQVDNVQVPSPPPTRPNGLPLTPSLATTGTPNGSCTTGYNNSPPTATGDIPWTPNNTPVNVCRVVPITSDVAAVNATYQAASPVSGTVWQYYEMIGTINPSVLGGPQYSFPNNTTATVNTNALANTTMETYSQGTITSPKSCMTCHAAFAAPQGAPMPLTSANQIFTFVLLNADNSKSQARRERQ